MFIFPCRWRNWPSISFYCSTACGSSCLSGPISAPVDPANWSSTWNAVRTESLQQRATSGNIRLTFSKSADGRSCQHHHFYIKLGNGEKVKNLGGIFQEKRFMLLLPPALLTKTEVNDEKKMYLDCFIVVLCVFVWEQIKLLCHVWQLRGAIVISPGVPK